MSFSGQECLNSTHFRRIRNKTEDEDEFYSIVNSRDELDSQSNLNSD